MNWWEMVEDVGDGTTEVKRFRTYGEAEEYFEGFKEFILSEIDYVDTEDPLFFQEPF